MALKDPIAVYNAATNVEAQLLRTILQDAGIEAFAAEDVSPVGVWMFGLIPEIHKPQVWVERSDVERVVPLLEQYEREQLRRRQENSKESDDEKGFLESSCEECGQTSTFPASQKGTVQYCPRCCAHMDVNDSPDADEWWRETGSDHRGCDPPEAGL